MRCMDTGTSIAEGLTNDSVQQACFVAKRALPVLLLGLFWAWETWRPFFGRREGRWQHGGRNLVLALINNVILALVFGTSSLLLTEWARQEQLGLLNFLDRGPVLRLVVALILLDLWMYLWHRANHAVPLLWRFHRMHHSDPAMDVTTATRFHLGEHVIGAVLRLGLIPLVGLDIWHLVIYDGL
jgi:sterol desaturase/sphingolipid hydroxylase (fatty acid hydroxylase superfamily)